MAGAEPGTHENSTWLHGAVRWERGPPVRAGETLWIVGSGGDTVLRTF